MKKSNTPLTEYEKSFAEKHHHFVFYFLRKQGLSDEWYDVVIFAYLHAVKNYLQRQDLQKYQFSTIAYYTMKGAIGNERRKKRISTISLESTIGDNENFSLMDTITRNHLDYIFYEGHTDMEIKYDVPIQTLFREKSEETIAIENFLKSNHKTMYFLYDTLEESKKRTNAMRKYRQDKHFYNVYEIKKRGKYVFIEKTEQFLQKVEQKKLQHKK